MKELHLKKNKALAIVLKKVQVKWIHTFQKEYGSPGKLCAADTPNHPR